MSTFRPAVKSDSKLRLALQGPSGSGKTYTALAIATGLAEQIGGKIAMIDSEHGSASKYADVFQFDVVEPFDHAIDTYVGIISDAAKAGYRVLIIDSLSHAWLELCNHVEKLAQTKFRGNTWSAWSEGTPLQRKLIEAILSFPGHVIATMRVTTEWTTEEDRNGKKRPVKLGLKPEQGKNIEYEFDMLMSLSVSHIGTVDKDRLQKYQDQVIEKPGAAFGAELAKLLGADASPTKPTETKAAEAAEPLSGFKVDKVNLAIRLYKLNDLTVSTILARNCEGITNPDDLNEDQADDVLGTIECIGHLVAAIADKGVTDTQLAKTLSKLNKKQIGELTADEANRVRAGIEKLGSKTVAA